MIYSCVSLGLRYLCSISTHHVVERGRIFLLAMDNRQFGPWVDQAGEKNWSQSLGFQRRQSSVVWQDFSLSSTLFFCFYLFIAPLHFYLVCSLYLYLSSFCFCHCRSSQSSSLWSVPRLQSATLAYSRGETQLISNNIPPLSSTSKWM